MRELLKNEGVFFIIKFLLFFSTFYFGTQVVIGLCAEAGYYSAFVAEHLDFIAWLRKIILNGGKLASGLLGLQTILRPPFILQIENGPAIKMVYSCIGIGIMSFWAAFVLANKASLIKKLTWTLGGLCLIYITNCWRIAILLYTLHKNGNINRFAEHHTLFNAICYVLIFIMMYFFTRKSSLLNSVHTNPATIDIK